MTTDAESLLTRAERAAAVEYMEFSSDTRENKQETASLRAAFIDGAEWHAAQQPSREQSIDVDKLARVIDQAADDWDLGIGNGGQTWEHALARAVVEHLLSEEKSNE